MLACGLLNQSFQLFVNYVSQLHFVSVLLVEINSTKYTSFVVRFLELLQQTQSCSRSYSLIFGTLTLSKVCKVGCPIPGHEQVQQLPRNKEEDCSLFSKIQQLLH